MPRKTRPAQRDEHLFRGVYAVGHPYRNENSRLMAAVLACGKGTVISHRSAAALLGLIDDGPVVIDLIAPDSRGREIDGICLRRVRPPRLEETGTFDGIPCTSPARTLVDLAGTVGEWTLRSAFQRAAQREMLDLGAIEASVDPRRRGMKVLLKLIDEWRRAAPLLKTRGKLKSPLEAKVLPLIVPAATPTARQPHSSATAGATGNSCAPATRCYASPSPTPWPPSSPATPRRPPAVPSPSGGWNFTQPLRATKRPRPPKAAARNPP
jgi:hypothetical protein